MIKIIKNINNIQFLEEKTNKYKKIYFDNIEYEKLAFYFYDNNYHLALNNKNNIEIYRSFDCEDWINIKNYNVKKCNDLSYQYDNKNNLILIVADHNNIKLFYNYEQNYKYLYNNTHENILINSLYHNNGHIYFLINDVQSLNIYLINEEFREIIKIKSFKLINKVIYKKYIENDNLKIICKNENIEEKNILLEIEIFLEKNTESVQKIGEIINFIITELDYDYGEYYNILKDKLKKNIRTNCFKNNDILNIDINYNNLFFGYTSLITKYSIPKFKDIFDIYPFIRDKENNIYVLENYEEDDTILSHICYISEISYALIKRHDRIINLSWKKSDSNEILKIEKNTNIFNYSGELIKVYFENMNISINNNNCIKLCSSN
jgi:hypothetical protein